MRKSTIFSMVLMGLLIVSAEFPAVLVRAEFPEHVSYNFSSEYRSEVISSNMTRGQTIKFRIEVIEGDSIALLIFDQRLWDRATIENETIPAEELLYFKVDIRIHTGEFTAPYDDAFYILIGMPESFIPPLPDSTPEYSKVQMWIEYVLLSTGTIIMIVLVVVALAILGIGTWVVHRRMKKSESAPEHIPAELD